MPAKPDLRNLFLSGHVLQVLMTCIFIFHNTAYSQKILHIPSKDKLISTLKKSNIDKDYTEAIDRFYFITCDSLINKKVTIDSKPVKKFLQSYL
jgi:hypothetical protein